MMNNLRILKTLGFASLFCMILSACSNTADKKTAQKPSKETDLRVQIPTPTSPVVAEDEAKVRQKVKVTGSRALAYKQAAELAAPRMRNLAHRMPMQLPLNEVDREKFQKLVSNKVTSVGDNPVSTFSIDVDTGSYALVRRFLKQGNLPNKNAVRLEEMVNYFDYDYAVPQAIDKPFVTSSALMKTPWNQGTHLLSVALKGWQPPTAVDLPMNLVFLVDVSGSMQSPDKLALVAKSLEMLTAHLKPQDKVAIVSYAGSSGVVLASTSGDKKSQIISALQNLRSGGGTNGAAGIETAYQIAKDNFVKDGINRVLLATDGDFNVGISDHSQLEALIEDKRKSGIFLNTLGFGSGNYNDHLMEQLADKGNGVYAYIDSIFEAKKVLVDEIGASMQTIAKDVKIQLEFNPDLVAEYRLLGYENRVLNETDFNNDKVDAGEIGAGHTVTALYEIALYSDSGKQLSGRHFAKNKRSNKASSNRDATSNQLAWLKLRYKKISEDKSQLMELPLLLSELIDAADSNQDFKFSAAVAAFAQQLKSGTNLQEFNFDETLKLAHSAKGYDPYGRKAEFIQLVSLAQELSR